MDNAGKKRRFVWNIDNYSFCSCKNGEKIDSRKFHVEGTTWFLRAYPRGNREESKGFISVFLYRSSVDGGPEDVLLKFTLALITEDLSYIPHSKLQHRFRKGAGCGRDKFVQIGEVLRRKTAFMPQDNLRLLCSIPKGEGNFQMTVMHIARTEILLQYTTFLHVIENFSALESNQKKTMQILLCTKDDCVLSSSVYATDGADSDRNIMVEIKVSSSRLTLSKFKLTLLATSGDVIKCGEADHRFDSTRQDIHQLSLSLTWKAVLNKKSEFLPDDKLSLLCECVFSSGVTYGDLPILLYEIPCMLVEKVMKNIRYTFRSLDYPSALEDFKGIFNSKFLSDVELKTKTKSFPAHKVVLCARSPVFKAMMCNDMQENNTNCINIDDLEDDILHQLLLFLYSDDIDNLHWTTATKLFYAADKYDIRKLKAICSEFLKDNLSTLTATELLLLADTHNDHDLKTAVEDFILEHEQEVYGSDEWEMLIETNPQLVIKTMHLKYRKNKVNTK